MQPIPKELKATPVDAASFVVTITQEMRTKGSESSHSFALPNLSAAITTFQFRQLPADYDVNFYSDDYDDEDYDDDEDEDEVRKPGDVEEEDEFRLTLDYNVTYNVLSEMDSAFPVPDDSEMVVRITYQSADGTDLFYHEFRGIFEIDYEVGGSKFSASKLSMPITLWCWEWSLFKLCKPKVAK